MRELFQAIGESFKEFYSSVKGEFFEDGQKGNYTASWGRVGEFLRSSHTGFAATSGKYMSMEASMEHVLILGGSGVGKSVNTTLVGVLEQQEASMVVLDNSGEMYDRTAAAKAHDGYTVIALDLDPDPDSFTEDSHFYNPLHRLIPDDTKGIAKLAHQLVAQSSEKRDFWSIKSEDVLVFAITVLLYRPKEERTLSNLHILLEKIASNEDEISEFVVGLPEEVFRKWEVLLNNSEKTLDSIRSSALSATSFISHSKGLQMATSKDTVDFNRLRSETEKVIVYLKTPIDDSSVKPLINIFFTQLFNHFLSKPRPSGKVRPLLMFCEEFGSTYIPGFDKIISNCRKWYIGCQMVVQSYQQLQKTYDREGLAIIKANCAKMIFTGSEESEEISRILGKVTFVDPETKHKRDRELMSSSEIRNLDDSQAIFLPRKGKPLLVKLKPFYLVPRLRKRTELRMPTIDGSGELPNAITVHLPPLNLPSHGKF